MKRSLLVGLSSLHQGENLFEFEHEPQSVGLDTCEVAENPSFECLVGTIRERVTVLRDGSRLLIRGRVFFRARLFCAVCGVEHEREFDEELMAEVLDIGRPQPSDDRGIDYADETMLTSNDFLDLTTLVRDAVHLAIPIAPVCREGCRGVCPECGTDLNEDDCNCHRR